MTHRRIDTYLRKDLPFRPSIREDRWLQETTCVHSADADRLTCFDAVRGHAYIVALIFE